MLLLLAACQVDHHVELLLGPNKDTPSAGFTCKDPANPTQLLIARGYTAADATLRFTLVVDVIDLGNVFPSCLGEDIMTACGSGGCQLSTQVAPKRFCEPVAVPNITSSATAARQIDDYLAAMYPDVIDDAPHRPVIVRAVALLNADCRTLQAATDGVYPSLDPDQALGCAYSCPVSLDDAQGTISLGLDTALAGSGASACVQAVKVCAEFPAGPI
jgi:hypothetical protein